jgi:hypothetical protein
MPDYAQIIKRAEEVLAGLPVIDPITPELARAVVEMGKQLAEAKRLIEASFGEVRDNQYWDDDARKFLEETQ